MSTAATRAGGAQEDDFDLDFTKILRAMPPPAAPAPEVRAAEAGPPAAPGAPPRAGNLVCYARASAAGRAARADAPVLVVEDHEASRRMLEKMMELLKLPVRSAADNREFARELRQPPLPRLILLDVGLPRVDGFQILSHLRAHPQTGAIPVVMVTARSDQKDVIRGLMLGADGYLSKPVSVKALRSVIETVLWKQ